MNPLASSTQAIDVIVATLFLFTIAYTLPIWAKANGLRPSVTFVLGITIIVGIGAALGIAKVESPIYPILRIITLLWIIVYVVRLARWDPNHK